MEETPIRVDWLSSCGVPRKERPWGGVGGKGWESSHNEKRAGMVSHARPFFHPRLASKQPMVKATTTKTWARNSSRVFSVMLGLLKK
tara:strand:- start:27482 stop:27742 length:261 start_codon:yes stop_codon:yes gene_type:complete